MSPPRELDPNLPPRQAATEYLEGLARHPNGDFYLPSTISGTKPMSDRQRQVAAQYEEVHACLNPRGDTEVAQAFRGVMDDHGRLHVVPSGPPVVGQGHTVEVPLADLEKPGTFTVVHNHNGRNQPEGSYFDPSYNLGSATDQDSTRKDVLAGRIKYAMVRQPDASFNSIDGGVPVREYRLEDRGPGHQTPPTSPGIS